MTFSLSTTSFHDSLVRIWPGFPTGISGMGFLPRREISEIVNNGAATNALLEKLINLRRFNFLSYLFFANLASALRRFAPSMVLIIS